MKCDSKLYINTNINIPIYVAQNSSALDMTQASRVVVSFVRLSDKNLIKEFDSDASGVELNNNSWIVKIRTGDIPNPVKVYVKVVMYDASGIEARLTPCPDKLQFVEY